MMSLAIDILVSILLVVTIGYASILNRRLKRLRDEEDLMRATIEELIKNSSVADRALKELKAMAQSSDSMLKGRLAEAQSISERLLLANEEGISTLSRLSASGVAGPDAPPKPDKDSGDADAISISPAFANLRESALRLSARAQQ